ncbi:MAG: hypothetical protein KGZ89_06535 [Actinobacteria bacterium]|nr:hypothetical protein [Actinomycetota bacterium]
MLGGQIRTHNHNVWLLLLTAPLLLAAFLSGATQVAVGAPSSAEIEAKRAEQQAALSELDRMRVALDQEIAEYVRLSRRLESARLEIDEVRAQIDVVDAELHRKEQAVGARAEELYRGEWGNLLKVLLQAESLTELFSRYRYMAIVNERDADMMRDMKLARVESEWLHHSLSAREQHLVEMQDQADATRERIEADIEAQETQAASLGTDLAEMMRQAAAAAAAAQFSGRPATSSPSSEFNPDTIISDANFRDADSMNAQQIQAFLEQQTGILARYRAPNHAGVMMSTAEMIEEAALAWRVNPKVILATLQKEQSLLSRRNPEQRALDWAMGCGKMDSRTLPQFEGFGRQIWHGARVLDRNTAGFRPGIELRISGSVVRPTNASTHTLYRYTPHMRGNMSFWLIYWRHFGDPLGGPGAL